jgi:hypothetical protein
VFTLRLPSGRGGALGQRQLRKCHQFETDLGDIAVRQLRKPSSRKINTPSDLRPYRGCISGITEEEKAYVVDLYASGKSTVQIGRIRSWIKAAACGRCPPHTRQAYGLGADPARGGGPPICPPC